MEVCYETFNGSIYFSEDMKQAFYISTGIDADINYGMYVRWLNQAFGVSIKRYFKPTVESLLKYGHKVRAIALYKRINRCTLMEAREEVEQIFFNMQSGEES